MGRKYWLGWSDTDEHKPEDFESVNVTTEQELIDLQERFAEIMAEDFERNEEFEGV